MPEKKGPPILPILRDESMVLRHEPTSLLAHALHFRYRGLDCNYYQYSRTASTLVARKSLFSADLPPNIVNNASCILVILESHAAMKGWVFDSTRERAHKCVGRPDTLGVRL